MARVLVIDDDRETRETLEEQLRRAGHGVQTTPGATGQQNETTPKGVVR